MAPADTGKIDTSTARDPHCARTARESAHQRTHLRTVRPLMCGGPHDSHERAYDTPTTTNTCERRRERSLPRATCEHDARRASGFRNACGNQSITAHRSAGSRAEECGFESWDLCMEAT